MGTEYLALVLVVLLVRAALGSAERPMSPGRLALSLLAQILPLAAMRKTPGLAVVAAFIAAVGAGSWVLERRGEARNLARFAAAVLLLAGLSLVGSPGRSAVRFADWAVGAARAASAASVLLSGVDERGLRFFLAVLSGALFASIEINHLTRYILVRLKVAPGAVADFTEAPTTAGVARDKGEVELRRGKMIGIMERLLVYYFVLTANLSAIGFVLAAKGFARFRELDDRDFAEYVLIGTLLSAAGAIAVGVATGLVLKGL